MFNNNFSYQKTYHKVYFLSTELALADDLRNLNWGIAFEFPEVALADMQRLVNY